MEHYLFDALKISPVPLETANKVTEVGWMLEIEKILNSILENSDKHYTDLAKATKEFIITLKEEMENSLKQMANENAFSDAITQRITDTISDLIGESIKTIKFGLDDKGRLIAEIPANYKELVFDTVTTEENYGKLILKQGGN